MGCATGKQSASAAAAAPVVAEGKTLLEGAVQGNGKHAQPAAEAPKAESQPVAEAQPSQATAEPATEAAAEDVQIKEEDTEAEAVAPRGKVVEVTDKVEILDFDNQLSIGEPKASRSSKRKATPWVVKGDSVFSTAGEEAEKPWCAFMQCCGGASKQDENEEDFSE